MKTHILVICLISFVAGCKSGTNALTEMSSKPSERSEIQLSIDALAHEPPRVIELGTPVAVDTENTKFIISKGSEALPPLVSSLEDYTNPTRIAYTAYCLRKLHSSAGKQHAFQCYSWYKKKAENLSVNERFALGELRQYLESIKQFELDAQAHGPKGPTK